MIKNFGRKIHIAYFLQELILFIGFQSLFVILLFGQFPQLKLFGSSLGGHAVYLLIVVVAVWFRHVHARHWVHKFISTTVPLFTHALLLLFASFEVLFIHGFTGSYRGDVLWMGVIAGMIAGGEYIIHNHGHRLA